MVCFSHSPFSARAIGMKGVLLAVLALPANPLQVFYGKYYHYINQKPNQDIKGERYNILSLDGGGSRGLMEALLLKDVMACLTMVQRGQLRAERSLIDFTLKEARVNMRDKLDNVENPMHPGDMFEMVAGTSTGALMAFGLLHGRNKLRLQNQIRDFVQEITQGA